MADEKDFTKAEFIEEEDRLRMENFHLKIQTIELQKQLADQQLEALEALGAKMRAQIIEFRKKLDAKYGMPMTPTAVDKSGRLLRPQQAEAPAATKEN